MNRQQRRHGLQSPRRPPAPDRLELYRWAVQDPQTQVAVLRLMFERLHPGHLPRCLREDFAGTSAEAVAWLAQGEGRTALAIDCDAATLDWARHRARRILGERAAALRFVAADVMRVAPPEIRQADLISVLNFSILYLRERATLLRYLRQAYAGLAAPGLLVLNVFGGSEALKPSLSRHLVRPQAAAEGAAPLPAFEYCWELRRADAATRRLDCRIHFALPDPGCPGGIRRLSNAFRYDWRLWSVDELCEALTEAGFDRVQVWRHSYDPARGAAGVFLGAVDPQSLQALPRWTAYVLASRSVGAEEAGGSAPGTV